MSQIDERIKQGELFRDEAMERVDRAASKTWKECADTAIHQLARTRRSLTSSDVWTLLDEWKVPRPKEPRAMGPRMKAAVDSGLISPTEGHRASTDPKAHRRPQRIYMCVQRDIWA